MTGYGNNTFQYGAYGIRCRKNNVHYTLDGNRILQEYHEDTGETLTFYYGEKGVFGFRYRAANGAENDYFYRKNLFGDVVAIYDANGQTVAFYSYDAWGRVSSATNSTALQIAEINPFRYRSYYYDTETCLYYLESRYYDPELCRFLNPDTIDYLGDGEELHNYNLFAYCGNNPVMYSDPTGHSILCAIALAGLGLTLCGLFFNNNVLTATGLLCVGGAALVSGVSAISGALASGAALTGVVGGATAVVGLGALAFMSAEIQEATGNGNWMIDAGMNESVYNALLATTAVLSTIGTVASVVSNSFNIHSVTEFGRINDSDFFGIKFRQIKNGKRYVSLEFHHGHAHKGHKLHWQLNSWSKSGNARRKGMAHWTMFFKRL